MPADWKTTLIRHAVSSLFRATVRIRVIGREHIPPSGPYILIANHFSIFEAPLAALLLPHPISFFTAAEFHHQGPMRWLQPLFGSLPIRRGQVDRSALSAARALLEAGGVLGIFPEGAIDPGVLEAIARGEPTIDLPGSYSRTAGRLLPGRPAAAYLALQSGVPILPVAFDGTELLLATLRRFRRPSVTIHIAPPIGPYRLDGSLRGSAKRQMVDRLSDLFMERLAALLPPEKRGPYRGISTEELEAQLAISPLDRSPAMGVERAGAGR